MKNSRTRSVALVAMASIATTACTRTSDGLAAPTESTTTVASTTASQVTQQSTEAVEVTPDTSNPAPTTTVALTLPPAAPPPSIIEVAEIGVPGLDSEDAFCSAWSRFAGSFQVVAVTAAFGSGSPEQLAALEVAAAPTVTRAYDDLLANWPEELASEKDVVAEGFLGPFNRRLAEARDALSAVGTDPATIDVISEAWLTGLANRDPSTPEFVVDLADDVWAAIDDAASVFVAQRVPFGSDPSLITDASKPLTDEYLAVSCPDQGTLSGQEVDPP